MNTEVPPISFLKIALFKDSREAFLSLLNEHRIEYTEKFPKLGVVQNAGFVFELVQSSAICGALATVICTFINFKKGRKVIITSNSGLVVHCEGLSVSEVQKVIESAESLIAIDTKANET